MNTIALTKELIFNYMSKLVFLNGIYELELWIAAVITYTIVSSIIFIGVNHTIEYLTYGMVLPRRRWRYQTEDSGYYNLVYILLLIPYLIGFILVALLSWIGFGIYLGIIAIVITLVIVITKIKTRDSRMVRKLLEERRKKQEASKETNSSLFLEATQIEETIETKVEDKQISINAEEVWVQQYFKACFDIGFQPDKIYNTNQVLRNKYNLLEELYKNQALMNEIKFKKQEENITSSTQFYYDNHEKINEYIKTTETEVINNKYNEYIQMRDIEIW